MKIVIGEIKENEVICEAEDATLRLPRRLFPPKIHVGDIADYSDGTVEIWDLDRQIEEEQLSMFFHMVV